MTQSYAPRYSPTIPSLPSEQYHQTMNPFNSQEFYQVAELFAEGLQDATADYESPKIGVGVLHDDPHNSVSSLSSNTNAGEMKEFPVVPGDLIPKEKNRIKDGYCKKHWDHAPLFCKALPNDLQKASKDHIFDF